MPQIDEKRLNELADIVFNRTNQLNDYVLETIGKRIKATGRASAYDQQALKNMADISGDMAKIKKKLAETMEMNVKDVEVILTQTVTEGVNSYKPLYDFKGMEFVPFEQNEYAQFLVNHWAKETSEQMINLSRTKALCFDRYNVAGDLIGSTPLEGAFQKAIDDAVIAVSSGTTDFNSAMRKTVESLGGSGVRVNYGGNVTRSLPSMVRQNLLYGAKQAAQAYDRYVGEQLGCDGFEVDYHSHPRPSHAFMGGNMYAYKGPVTIDGKMYPDGAEAIARLSDHGCPHFKTDVILGVSEPRYDEKWLKEQKQKDKELIEYNGVKKTKYEWQQGARRLERGIRKERDMAYMAKASGDKTIERKANEKIAIYRKGYDDLCDKVGLEKRYNRMATFPSKTVDKVVESGIIKEQSKKNITAITENAIKKVPKVSISGFNDEQNAFIQRQHKELLKYAKENNNSKEVAFVFREGLIDRTEYIGTDSSIDFGIALEGKGNNLFVMHNHPRTSSYSDTDIVEFISSDSIKTLSIVKNNGSLEVLSKADLYNKRTMAIEQTRYIKKYVESGTDKGYSVAVRKLLEKAEKKGYIEWIR